jgi:ribosome-binding factor A
MANMTPRAQRVADQIQRILADLIQREIRDPRLGMISVTGVDVSRDFSYATVFVTVMSAGAGHHNIGTRLKDMSAEDQEDIKQNLQILNRAAGFLRGQLARSLSLRVIPSLKFRYDESIGDGQYLSSLIDDAISSDAEHADRDDNEES